MAKYLWVGGAGSTGATLTGTDLVDQYCFNKSGNWYRIELVNGQSKWVPTSAVPGNGDSVVFGKDFPFTSNGWTGARSPCLYGGFSGGVGPGVWTMTGPTATSGTTFTSSLNSITVKGLTSNIGGTVRGYLFPYLGGGISGEIAEWCAFRDNVGITYYTAANSTGFRDPSQNLRLKWSGNADIETKHPILSTGVTSAQYNTVYTKFITDFDCVKGPAPLSGGSAGSAGTGSNPVVSTQLKFNAGGGAGLRIRGGSFSYITCNMFPNQSSFYTNPYSYISDNGIEIYDAYIDNIVVKKIQSTYVSGCTASTIYVYPFAWKTNPNNTTYEEQVDIEISSNINALSAYTDLYGITLASDLPEEDVNELHLSFTPISFPGMGYDIVPDPSQTSNNRQVVIFGDRRGTKTCSVPKIKMYSGQSVTEGSSGSYSYMPWAVEFAGTVKCNLIDNNAGYIYSNADIQQSSTVSVSELKLSNYGTLDFAKNSSVFDDWRFGGLTASGTQIAGGIIFTDETAKVLGSAGLRLWNTQTKGGGIINTRITDTKSYSIPNVPI